MTRDDALQKMVRMCTGGFVLAFHQISTEKFATLAECLHPAQPVPLTELVDRAKRGQPTGGLFAITVDDGVAENVRSLAALCMRRSWPVTFYLPTEYMDTGDGMAFQWWQGVEPHLPRRRLTLPSGTLDLTAECAIPRLGKAMEKLWHSAPRENYLPLTMELVGFVVDEELASRQDLEPPPPIPWPEVERLSRCPWIQFESHGVTHTAMSALPPGQVLEELRASRDTVQEHTGQPCRHLAYPFGSPRSIGNIVPALASEFYDSAVTMSLGSVDGANPWLLPRIPLYPENSELFARLKIILKCGALPLVRPEPQTVAAPAV